MEIGDVLANEMVLFNLFIVHVLLKASCISSGPWAPFVKIIFQRGQVANGGIQPDVEVFAWRIGNLNAKVRRVTADVPVPQATFALLIGGEPFTHLVGHLTLKLAVLCPSL